MNSNTAAITKKNSEFNLPKIPPDLPKPQDLPEPQELPKPPQELSRQQSQPGKKVYQSPHSELIKDTSVNENTAMYLQKILKKNYDF